MLKQRIIKGMNQVGLVDKGWLAEQVNLNLNVPTTENTCRSLQSAAYPVSYNWILSILSLKVPHSTSVHRGPGSGGRGHAAQLHRTCSDNLWNPRSHHPVCQTNLCGHAGGRVCQDLKQLWSANSSKNEVMYTVYAYRLKKDCIE